MLLVALAFAAVWNLFPTCHLPRHGSVDGAFEASAKPVVTCRDITGTSGRRGSTMNINEPCSLCGESLGTTATRDDFQRF